MEDLIWLVLDSMEAPAPAVTKAAAGAAIFPQQKFRQSFPDYLSKWDQRARALLSMKRMAQWWFQLNLVLVEVDLMEEMAIQVEGVQILVMVEAMALMEFLLTKMGMEESAVVWI